VAALAAAALVPALPPSQSASRLSSRRAGLGGDRDLPEPRLLLLLPRRLRRRWPRPDHLRRRDLLWQEPPRQGLLRLRPRLRLREAPTEEQGCDVHVPAPRGLLSTGSLESRRGCGVLGLLEAALPHESQASLRRLRELVAASASHFAKISCTAAPTKCQCGGGLGKQASGARLPSGRRSRSNSCVIFSSVKMVSDPAMLHHTRLSVSSIHRLTKASKCCKSPKCRAVGSSSSSKSGRRALAKAAKALLCTL